MCEQLQSHLNGKLVKSIACKLEQLVCNVAAMGAECSTNTYGLSCMHVYEQLLVCKGAIFIAGHRDCLVCKPAQLGRAAKWQAGHPVIAAYINVVALSLKGFWYCQHTK